MEWCPNEVLAYILWDCIPDATGKQIWPVMSTCRRWYHMLTDVATIPQDFGQIYNLGLVLHITKTKLTVEQFQEHFDNHTIKPAFLSMYNKQKWLKYAPFIIPTFSDLITESVSLSTLNRTVRSLCQLSRTADSFFHLYHLAAAKLVINDTTIPFAYVVNSIARGGKIFQLKHVNWLCKRMYLDGCCSYPQSKRTYCQLVRIGLASGKIRLLFDKLLTAVNTYNISNHYYRPTIILSWYFAYDISMALMQCYCHRAFRQLSRRRPIDRLLAEILHYETKTNTCMSMITHYTSFVSRPGLEDKICTRVNARYAIIKMHIQALRQ